MARKRNRVKNKTYRVLVGISHRKLGIRYEPGEIVQLGPEWDIAGFLDIRAIEEVPEEIKPKEEAPIIITSAREVANGNGKD